MVDKITIIDDKIAVVDNLQGDGDPVTDVNIASPSLTVTKQRSGDTINFNISGGADVTYTGDPATGTAIQNNIVKTTFATVQSNVSQGMSSLSLNNIDNVNFVSDVVVGNSKNTYIGGINSPTYNSSVTISSDKAPLIRTLANPMGTPAVISVNGTIADEDGNVVVSGGGGGDYTGDAGTGIVVNNNVIGTNCLRYNDDTSLLEVGTNGRSSAKVQLGIPTTSKITLAGRDFTLLDSSSGGTSEYPMIRKINNTRADENGNLNLALQASTSMTPSDQDNLNSLLNSLPSEIGKYIITISLDLIDSDNFVIDLQRFIGGRFFIVVSRQTTRINNLTIYPSASSGTVLKTDASALTDTSAGGVLQKVRVADDNAVGDQDVIASGVFSLGAHSNNSNQFHIPEKSYGTAITTAFAFEATAINDYRIDSINQHGRPISLNSWSSNVRLGWSSYGNNPATNFDVAGSQLTATSMSSVWVGAGVTLPSDPAKFLVDRGSTIFYQGKRNYQNAVMTVNNTVPDAAGNVNVSGGGGAVNGNPDKGIVVQSDTNTVETNFADKNGAWIDGSTVVEATQTDSNMGYGIFQVVNNEPLYKYIPAGARFTKINIPVDLIMDTGDDMYPTVVFFYNDSTGNKVECGRYAFKAKFTVGDGGHLANIDIAPDIVFTGSDLFVEIQRDGNASYTQTFTLRAIWGITVEYTYQQFHTRLFDAEGGTQLILSNPFAQRMGVIKHIATSVNDINADASGNVTIPIPTPPTPAPMFTTEDITFDNISAGYEVFDALWDSLPPIINHTVTFNLVPEFSAFTIRRDFRKNGYGQIVINELHVNGSTTYMFDVGDVPLIIQNLYVTSTSAASAMNVGLRGTSAMSRLIISNFNVAYSDSGKNVNITADRGIFQMDAMTSTGSQPVVVFQIAPFVGGQFIANHDFPGTSQVAFLGTTNMSFGTVNLTRNPQGSVNRTNQGIILYIKQGTAQ
jgi:hypothetical protein